MACIKYLELVVKVIKESSQKDFSFMGRLVQNHSTNIEGLIKWLKKIAENKEIKTITPAVVSKTNGRGERLILKLTIKTKEGFKLLARKGKLVQEVFLVTHLNKKEILKIIENTNPSLPRKRKAL